CSSDLESGDCTCLGEEACALGRRDITGGHELHRHAPIQKGVVREVDAPHAPRPQQPLQAVLLHPGGWRPHLAHPGRTLPGRAGLSWYCFTLRTKVRSGIPMSAAARVCTPPVAASASVIRRRSSSRSSSASERKVGAASTLPSGSFDSKPVTVVPAVVA